MKARYILTLLILFSSTSFVKADFTNVITPSETIISEPNSTVLLQWSSTLSHFEAAFLVVQINASHENIVDYSLSVDGVDRTEQLTYFEESGSVYLSNNDLDPPTGDLLFEVLLSSSNHTEIPWRFIQTGFINPTTPPVFQDLRGIVSIIEPNPANITITNFQVDPSNIRQGDSIHIEATLMNSGGVPGNYQIQIKMDDEFLDEKIIQIAPESTVIHEYSFQSDKLGEHTITFNEKSVEFTVKTRSINSYLIGGGLMLLIGVIIIFKTRKGL